MWARGARGNGISVMGPMKRVRSWIGRLTRHHVTPGDEYNAQWPFLRPYTARTIMTLGRPHAKGTRGFEDVLEGFNICAFSKLY